MGTDSISSAWLRWSVCWLSVGLAAGCGGGSGGGNSGGGGGSANSTTVTFHFSGSAPTAVAAKIGSGAYMTQTLTAGDLTLSIPSGTTDFAVAYVCPRWPNTIAGVPTGQIAEQWVDLENLADGISFYESCDPLSSSAQTGSLTGRVDATALAGISYVSIQAGNSNTTLGTQFAGSIGDFSFAAPAGNDAVAVLAYSENAQGLLPPSLTLVAAKTFVDQAIPGALNGGNPVVLSAGDGTTPQPITYENVPSGYGPPTTAAFFHMDNQAVFELASRATSTYPAMPAAAVRSGDSYGFIATAYQNGIPGVALGPAVMVQTSPSAGGPVTFSFPAPWRYNGPSPAALPAFDFTYSGFSGKAGVHRGVFLAWSGANGDPNQYTFSISSSPKYRGGASDVVFPDLSTLSGFLAGPPSGTHVVWLADIAQVDTSSRTNTVVESSGMFSVP